jgi:hypothetical protein
LEKPVLSEKNIYGKYQIDEKSDSGLNAKRIVLLSCKEVFSRNARCPNESKYIK